MTPPIARRTQRKRIQERHANIRAQERIGVVLTDDLRTRIVRAIKRTRRWRKRLSAAAQSGGRKSQQYGALQARQETEAVFVCNSALGRERWRIELDDLPVFRVIYEPRRRVIITILN